MTVAATVASGSAPAACIRAPKNVITASPS